MGCGCGGLRPAKPGAGLGSAGCCCPCCCCCTWGCMPTCACMAASVVGGMKMWLVKVCVVIPVAGTAAGLLSMAVVTAGCGCGGGGAWCGGLCCTTTTAGSMWGASMSIWDSWWRGGEEEFTQSFGLVIRQLHNQFIIGLLEQNRLTVTCRKLIPAAALSGTEVG